MIINIEEIKELIGDDSVTAYSIAQETGMVRQTIQNYRNGNAELMNMSLKNAAALQKYVNKKGENKMNKEKIVDYLEDYGLTTSNELDPVFGIFKSDVWGIAKEVSQGEAYVYSKEEYLEFIEEQDEEVKGELKEVLPNYEFDVAINTSSDHTYFI